MDFQRNDVILTTVEGVGFDYFAPFILSLKRTGFRGQLVVFAGALDDRTITKIRDHGAFVVRYPFVPKWVREALFWPVWPAWSRFFSRCRLTAITEKLAHWTLPLIYRRHLIYLQFLRGRRHEFGRVFLSDARDVFFQVDPFSWQPGPGLHCFLLPHGNTIQSEQLRINWDQNQFGRTDPRPHLDKGVACAGTTFGDTESVIQYLSQIVSFSLRARKLRKVKVGDQGVQNFLICEDILPATTLQPNEGGPVLTTYRMTMDDIVLDKDGVVVNDRGRVIPVLHQYDRIPELKKHLLGRLQIPG
ncbi:MAG: hypothetical protein ACRED1_06330 [Limisphaerales bacterium]